MFAVVTFMHILNHRFQWSINYIFQLASRLPTVEPLMYRYNRFTALLRLYDSMLWFGKLKSMLLQSALHNIIAAVTFIIIWFDYLIKEKRKEVKSLIWISAMNHLMWTVWCCFVLSGPIKYELWGIASFKLLNNALVLFIIVEFRVLKLYLQIVQRNTGTFCQFNMPAGRVYNAYLYNPETAFFFQRCEDSGRDICQE